MVTMTTTSNRKRDLFGFYKMLFAEALVLKMDGNYRLLRGEVTIYD